MISAYFLPAMDIEAVLVYTNTCPTGFIRGGGRPLGNYAIERAVDALATELKIDRVELRRRNLVAPQQIPYTTGLLAGRGGYVYDSGDYPKLLDLAVEEIGKKPAADGKLIGLGFACCVESTALGRGAEVLEADAQDLVIEDGAITVRGTPTRRVPVTDVIPDQGLEVLETFDPARPLTFSSGCHAAIVAVDPDTGHVEVLRYVIA